MRLGHFDPNGALQEIPEAVICSAKHAVTAREGAIQGSTLLKNSAKTLPLKAGALKVVAVIGPNADLSKAIAGYYGSGDPCKVRLEIALLNASQAPFLVAMRCYFLHS
jgi:beta-D-xylosidase 4